MEKKLRAKYRKQLKVFEKGGDGFQDCWLALLRDLINVSESTWDYESIRYQTVMNLEAWQDFVRHPQRVPYRSRLVDFPDGQDERLSYILEILKDSLGYYRSLKKDDGDRQMLKVSMGMVLDCALNARYFSHDIHMSDCYVGRTREQRDNGEIDPTPMGKSRLAYAIREYCEHSDSDVMSLEKKVERLSQGRLDILEEYFSTCDVDDKSRDEIRGIMQILGRDQTRVMADVWQGFKIWKRLVEMGIDVDTYLELGDLPKYKTVEKRLLESQSNKEFIAEIEKHMADELPEGYERYKKQGYIYSYELRAEEARRKKYPKELRGQQEIDRMVEECKQEVWGYFPLARRSSPTNILFNPTHPAATSRAFQSTTSSQKGHKVNAIVMTPRSIQKDDYLRVLAHETGHLIHRMVLDLADVAGILNPGDNDRVPMSVMEEFSQLVEHVFKADRHVPYEKQYQGKEFPDFWSGMAARFQVPFALVQLSVRRDFEVMIKKGCQDIREEELWALKAKYDKLAKGWLTLGLAILPDNMNSFYLFNSHNPDDGLVYMKRYIVAGPKKMEKEAREDNDLRLGQAFVKRFGDGWVKKAEARAMLLWLMLESGRNHRTESYAGLVLKKEVVECREELRKIGLSELDI